MLGLSHVGCAVTLMTPLAIEGRPMRQTIVQQWKLNELCLIKYSSVSNKHTGPNRRLGWNFDKKMNKRAALNRSARFNFAWNTKRSGGWKLAVLFIITARYPEKHWNTKKNSLLWDPNFLIKHIPGIYENIRCVSNQTFLHYLFLWKMHFSLLRDQFCRFLFPWP